MITPVCDSLWRQQQFLQPHVHAPSLQCQCLCNHVTVVWGSAGSPVIPLLELRSGPRRSQLCFAGILISSVDLERAVIKEILGLGRFVHRVVVKIPSEPVPCAS